MLPQNLLLLFTLVILVGCGKSPAAPSPDLDIIPKNSHPNTVVIFIHGVLGDSITSFRSENNQKSWPELLSEDKSLSEPIHVKSLSYSSKPLSNASNINEISTGLLNKLVTQDVFNNHDKVIFITHSMGGLITKRMLVQLNLDHPDMYKKVAGIFFIATPSDGSNLANIASWFSKNPQFNDMSRKDSNTFLQSTEGDWQSLLKKRNDQYPFPKAFCVYETLPLGPVKVVPRSNVQMGCDERPDPFDRDHISIVKPSSVKDEVYEYIATRIKNIVLEVDLPMSISAKIIDSSNQVIEEGSVLKSRDQYALNITLSKPGWLYVFNRDSTHTLARYFPSNSHDKKQNPSKKFRVPSKDSNWITLDTHTGIERFFIYATDKKDEKLENLGDVVLSKLSQKEIYEIHNELMKRGGFEQEKHIVTSSMKHQYFNMKSIKSEATATLDFEHQ